MQNSISFSIESIISKRDPPRQTDGDSSRYQGFQSRAGPLSAMQNLVELSIPRRVPNCLEEKVLDLRTEQQQLDQRWHNDLSDKSSISPSSKLIY